MIIYKDNVNEMFIDDEASFLRYEKLFYELRKCYMEIFAIKGVTNYRKFKTMVLAYFPNCCVLDIAAFWEGIMFKEAFLHKLKHIDNVAVDKFFEQFKAIKK